MPTSAAPGTRLEPILDAWWTSHDQQASDRLLDIATGGGHVARAFAAHVAEVVVSDLTPEILGHAAAFLEAKGVTNATSAEVDAEQLPFDDGEFDIVT